MYVIIMKNLEGLYQCLFYNNFFCFIFFLYFLQLHQFYMVNVDFCNFFRSYIHLNLCMYSLPIFLILLLELVTYMIVPFLHWGLSTNIKYIHIYSYVIVIVAGHWDMVFIKFLLIAIKK